MKNLIKRIIDKLNTNKGGLTVFLVIFAATVILILNPSFLPGGSVAVGSPIRPVKPVWTPPANLNFSGALSHTKVIQGGDNRFYLKLEVDVPRVATDSSVAIKPADVVVVLDRSGSMSDKNKLEFAKKAIRDLVSRLKPEDRFALVSFDDRVIVHQHLSSIPSHQKERLYTVVSNLRPGGSTNMSAGLLRARDMLGRSTPDRSRSVILLSDGHANAGISDRAGLTRIGKSFVEYSSILSTIGMGLGFNEDLMAALADHGMGSYSFLEHLGGLDQIFARILEDSQNIYAASSELHIKPAKGVTIVDASGYPIEFIKSRSGRVRIPTGQLVAGSKKQLTVTFRVPTVQTGGSSVGDLALVYHLDGKDFTASLDREQLAYEIVEPARKKEALASYNQAVWKDSWLFNKLGGAKRSFHSALKSGDKAKANKVINDYKKDLREAEQTIGITLNNEDLDGKLQVMEEQLDDAFIGTPQQQVHKRNRYGKINQSSGYALSRGKK